MKAEVQVEADDALVANNLDHLMAASVAGTDVVDDSVIAQMVSASGTADWDTFDNATDSSQAIRDRGDAAWITGGGGGITDIINLQPQIPTSVDLADTATVELGIMLINSLDDLPSTAEISPGTIDIARKAIGATSWTAIVTGTACSERAGQVFFNEVFDSGTGYAEGDSIRITFKNQKVTVAANDYEITSSDGIKFYTEIRQTMRGTDSAATASALSTHDGKLDTVDTNVDSILVETGEIGTAGAGLTDLGGMSTGMKAEVNAECDTAVNDYNTTAMTEAYAADGSAPTPEQMRFMIWSALGEFAISGTTITAKKLDGSTTAMTFTLDDGTNPTSRTRAT
jgi:hypothetical protein